MSNILRFLERLQSDAYDPLAVTIELLLIGLSVNWCAGVLQGTRGTRPLRGFLIVLVAVTLGVRVLSIQFQWTRLALLYQYFVYGLAFIALVAFQPELRRAVIRVGDVRFLRRGSPQSKLVSALVKSAGFLSKNRYGALIAIQRGVDLRGWAENGTMINAEVSPNLLNTIFFPNSPLHDLGVIIKGTRVLAANCQFPQVSSDEVDAALGSRHLAAVAMSYESDALVLVVSEETGTISLADTGKLTRYLSLDDLADELALRLSGTTPKPKAKRRLRPLHDTWRVARRILVVLPLTIVIWYLADQACQIEVKGVKVQLDMIPNHPARVVEVNSPSPPVFTVTFRGSTRAADRLRLHKDNDPLETDYSLSESYDRPGQYTLDTRELLNNLASIRTRGVLVQEAVPDTVIFSVAEQVTTEMMVSADAGAVEVDDVRFSPPRVEVTLRRDDLESLPPNKRVVIAPLAQRLRNVDSGEVVSLQGVPLVTHVDGRPALKIRPETVNVSLLVVGQRVARRLESIPVRVSASPEFLQRYEVEPRDPLEWTLEVEVEGDQGSIESLRTTDVRAYVSVSSDLVQSPPEFRLVPVTVELPEGIELLSSVRWLSLRIVPRESGAR